MFRRLLIFEHDKAKIQIINGIIETEETRKRTFKFNAQEVGIKIG